MDITDNDKKLTPEEFSDRRKKELAILKASNQMLEDAKNNLISLNEDEIDLKKYSGVQELSKNDKISAIEEAQKFNLEMGKRLYGASEQEIDSATYHGPDKITVEKYKRRLKMKGLTDEQIHEKKLTNTKSGKDVSYDGLIEDYTGTGKSQRRTRNVKKEEENEYSYYEEKAPEITLTQDKTVEIAKQEPVNIKDETDKISNNTDDKSYKFDISDIPDYVQYDVIPLPSNGECYPHKINRIPVAYLTGSDENIIASPNMYRDGKLIDVILKRKVLDSRIDVDDLVAGDRDAITLWLRATAYGPEFPITTTNPSSGKQYDTTINLSDFKYNKFELKGDENGLFEYTVGKNVLKFKFLTKKDEDELRQELMKQISDGDKLNIIRSIDTISDSLSRIDISDKDREYINEDIEEIRNVVNSSVSEKADSYPKTVTEGMIRHTVSVNGNTDSEYIRNFIENMRAGDARKYRDYIMNNKPGVDFTIKIEVPESDGGGSFTTFLGLDDSIFYV